MGIYTISLVPSITPGILCVCVCDEYEHVCVCVNMWRGVHMCGGQRYFYQLLFTLSFEIEPFTNPGAHLFG